MKSTQSSNFSSEDFLSGSKVQVNVFIKTWVCLGTFISTLAGLFAVPDERVKPIRNYSSYLSWAVLWTSLEEVLLHRPQYNDRLRLLYKNQLNLLLSSSMYPKSSRNSKCYLCFRFQAFFAQDIELSLCHRDANKRAEILGSVFQMNRYDTSCFIDNTSSDLKLPERNAIGSEKVCTWGNCTCCSSSRSHR